MKDSSIRRFSLVPYALALAVVGALGAALTWLKWGDVPAWIKGELGPAWIQAAGSLLALAIAIAVPAVQHHLAMKERQREARDRARSLGLELYPHMEELVQKNSAIWDFEHPDHDVRDIDVNACVIGIRTKRALDIPPGIEAKLGSLHELGPAAEGIQIAVYNISRAKQLLTTKQLEGTSSVSGMAPFLETITFDKKQFFDLMWGAVQGLTLSQNRIEGLFKHHPRPSDPITYLTHQAALRAGAGCVPCPFAMSQNSARTSSRSTCV